MNWDDLRLFLAVCRQPRLEDTAIHTGLDATTISRRIKRLEQDLGLTLFERSRRGHRMTPSGERIAALCETIESTALEILALGGAEAALAGRVRLGAPEGFGATVIAPALATFRREHPQIDVDLIALSGFVSVPKRQADMSILLTRPTTGRLKVRSLGDYELHLYASADYVAGAPPLLQQDDLRNHTLIGYSEDLIYSSQLRYLSDIVPGLAPQLCSPSIIAQQTMVAAGAGVGILPAFMARQDQRLVRVVPDVTVTRTFWLSVHEDVAGLTRVREVISFLTDLRF